MQDAETAEYTLGTHPQQLHLYKQNPTAAASHLLASAIASNKTWAGTWSIKALAVALHRNFVVINPERCELYTRDDAVDGRGSQTWPSVFYPRGKRTRKGDNWVICLVRLWMLPHASWCMMGKHTSGQLCMMRCLQPWRRCWQLAWSLRHHVALSKQLFGLKLQLQF